MEKTAVWGFRWAPPFAQGLVRDLRVRWALEEAGACYESRLIGFDERTSDAYRRYTSFCGWCRCSSPAAKPSSSRARSSIQSPKIARRSWRRSAAPKRLPGCSSRSTRSNRR